MLEIGENTIFNNPRSSIKPKSALDPNILFQYKNLTHTYNPMRINKNSCGTKNFPFIIQQKGIKHLY